MNETSVGLIGYGTLLVVGIVAWTVERRRIAKFRLEVERNRGLGLYKGPEFKKRSRLLLRVRSIAGLLILLLAAVPFFVRLSDLAWAILLLVVLIMFIVNLTAGSKWRRLMKEGIKK